MNIESCSAYVRKKQLPWMTTLTLALCFWVNICAAGADIIILDAVDSGRVRSSTPNENFAGGNLVVQSNPGHTTVNQSYIKFDLTDVLATEINSATLRLNLRQVGGATTVKVYSCADDSWSGATLTWNNRPAPGTEQASIALTTTLGWYEADITSWVAGEFDGDKMVTVVILDDHDPGLNVNSQYYSVGTGGPTNGPKLVIEVEGAPDTISISGAVSVDGTGLGGVTMSGFPGNPITDTDGTYTASVPAGWSGTATPVRVGYIFEPPSRTYTDVQADLLEEDYTGAAEHMAGWEFMTPTSYWSYPIQQAPVDPNSDYYIAHWKEISTNHGIRMNSASTGDFGFALYIGTESDPIWEVTDVTGTVHLFHGPANMVPSPGDFEVACIDTTQDAGYGVLYQFGGMGGFNWRPSTRTGTCPWRGSVNYLKSNGLDGRAANSDDLRNTGHRGLPIMTFGFLVSAVQRQHVPNLVKLTVPRSGKSPFLPRKNHVWPYVGNEGDTTNLPEGARVRLKASVQPRIDAMTNPYARAMAQALLTYGSIISDQGSQGINIKVQTNDDSMDAWQAMGVDRHSLEAFTIDDFEFVELGWTPPGM